jgi:hypothetical protein
MNSFSMTRKRKRWKQRRLRIEQRQANRAAAILRGEVGPQQSFFVNPHGGDDDAAGGINAPLRTITEVNRRLARVTGTTNVTITLLTATGRLASVLHR